MLECGCNETNKIRCMQKCKRMTKKTVQTIDRARLCVRNIYEIENNNNNKIFVGVPEMEFYVYLEWILIGMVEMVIQTIKIEQFISMLL